MQRVRPSAQDGPRSGWIRRRLGALLRRLGPRRWWLMNLYPPLLGAGIRVIPGGEDGLDFTIRMKLTPWNRNYLGTHYGGSLYSLCDPFFLLILIERLGSGYVVWDKEATIRFVRPGRGTVEARFVLDREQVEDVRRRAEGGDVVEPRYQVKVRDPEGRTVAVVEKLLYVRKKQEETAAAD